MKNKVKVPASGYAFFVAVIVLIIWVYVLTNILVPYWINL